MKRKRPKQVTPKKKNDLTLFSCPNVRTLRLTKRACSELYYTANREGHTGQNLSQDAHIFCDGCATGKKIFALFPEKEIKETINAKKQCFLYQVDPTQCANEKIDGWFYKKRKQLVALWNKKQFCCQECAVRYNLLKSKGKIK